MIGQGCIFQKHGKAKYILETIAAYDALWKHSPEQNIGL